MDKYCEIRIYLTDDQKDYIDMVLRGMYSVYNLLVRSNNTKERIEKKDDMIEKDVFKKIIAEEKSRTHFNYYMIIPALTIDRIYADFKESWKVYQETGLEKDIPMPLVNTEKYSEYWINPNKLEEIKTETRHMVSLPLQNLKYGTAKKNPTIVKVKKSSVFPPRNMIKSVAIGHHFNTDRYYVKCVIKDKFAEEGQEYIEANKETGLYIHIGINPYIQIQLTTGEEEYYSSHLETYQYAKITRNMFETYEKIVDLENAAEKNEEDLDAQVQWSREKTYLENLHQSRFIYNVDIIKGIIVHILETYKPDYIVIPQFPFSSDVKRLKQTDEVLYKLYTEMAFSLVREGFAAIAEELGITVLRTTIHDDVLRKCCKCGYVEKYSPHMRLSNKFICKSCGYETDSANNTFTNMKNCKEYLTGEEIKNFYKDVFTKERTDIKSSTTAIHMKTTVDRNEDGIIQNELPDEGHFVDLSERIFNEKW